MEIDLPSPLGARTKEKSLPASHPCPAKKKAKKKAEKKIEEVISRPCVSDEGCGRNPGETVKALPGRPGWGGCGLPGAPKLPPGCRARGAFVLSQRMACHCPAPQLPQIKCTNQGFPSRRPFAASHSRPRDAPRDTNHESRPLWPFGWPLVRKGRTTRNRRPDRRARRPVNASLLTSARNCPELPRISRLLFIACLLTIAPLCGGLCAIVQYGGAVLLPLSQCPRTVHRSRSASRRAPLGAAPVALRACSAVANAK